jgi:hypothetical protein
MAGMARNGELPSSGKGQGRRKSGEVYDLTGLRSGNNSLKVGILAAVISPFIFFNLAFSFALFFVLALLPADPFSIALFHTVLSQGSRNG